MSVATHERAKCQECGLYSNGREPHRCLFPELVEAAGVPLSDAELRTMRWLAGTERDSVENVIAVFRRSRDAVARMRRACETVADDIDDLHISIGEVDQGDKSLEAISGTVAGFQQTLRRACDEDWWKWYTEEFAPSLTAES